MSLKAAIFDFDGLILDTEHAEFDAWQSVYREHGVELAFADWSVCIGTAGAFDPCAHLEKLTGRAVDRPRLMEQYRALDLSLLAKMDFMPGVRERLKEAKGLGLKLAIASSSDQPWVEDHLRQRGLLHEFDAILVRNERFPAKPLPDIYLAALGALEVQPGEAVALEDSMNGIAAAKAAGIYCIAVPNEITRRLDLSRADRQVSSLNAFTFDELRAEFAADGWRPR